MKSRLLLTRVYHKRFFPREYSFPFRLFWFDLDIDELPTMDKKLKFFSLNQFNLFSFYDRDHWYEKNLDVKENIKKFLFSHNIDDDIESIRLVSSLRILGYVFNPVCFYFVEMKNSHSYCIAEICNTFKELKPILIPKDANSYKLKCSKNFYVSPFTQIKEMMEFNIDYNQKILKTQILTYNKSLVEVSTSSFSEPITLSDMTMLKSFFRFPLLTLQVIFFIHYHALRLFLMKVPYKKKTDDLEYQQGAIKWRQ